MGNVKRLMIGPLSVAQDFYEHGYDVTIVQRSSTYVSALAGALAHLRTQGLKRRRKTEAGKRGIGVRADGEKNTGHVV